MPVTVNESWIIIDLVTSKSLYGSGFKTLQFSSQETATEVAEQFFSDKNQFLIVKITQ